MCDIDSAYLLVARACADIDGAALRREKLDLMTRARVRMDTGHAAKLCRESINKLLSVNGAGSFALANPLQRIWRDSEIASRHAFVHPEMASLIYGRALFGIEELIQPY
ncbi:alkylation response protein AidB-like acyl-CoA dehydrogenase [Bradyrhizobium sp. USDA 3240]